MAKHPKKTKPTKKATPKKKAPAKVTSLDDKRKAKAESAPADRPASIRFKAPATVSTISPQPTPKTSEADWCPCGGRLDRRGKMQRCTRIAEAKYHADGCPVAKPYNPTGSAARTEKKVAKITPRPTSSGLNALNRAAGKPVFILLYEDMAERILAGTVTDADRTDIHTRLDVARAKKGQKAS